MTARACLAVATAILSTIAAGLWWYASWVRVSVDQAAAIEKEKFKRTGKHRPVALAFKADADLQYTLDAQSRWNQRAALAAGAAAMCQAAYVIVTEFV